MEAFLSTLLQGADEDMGAFVLASFVEDGSGRTLPFLPELGAEAVISETAASWSAEAGRNVYYGAALMDPAATEGGKRGKAENVRAMLAVVIDLDDADAAANWRQRAERSPAGNLQPTAVVRTSSEPLPRYQLVYVLDEPETDIATWRDAARRLEAHFGADWCSKDPAHVWRMPGTKNYPNAKKRAAGRIVEEATLVHLERGRTFDVSDFLLLPEPAEPEATEPVDLEHIALSMRGATQDWTDYGEILLYLPAWLQKAIITGDVYRDAAGNADRSTFDFQIAKEVCRAGLSVTDYAMLYHLAQNEAFAAKWRGKEAIRPGGGDAYLMRTFARAADAVAREPKPEPERDAHHDVLADAETPPDVPVEGLDAFAFNYSHIKDTPEIEVEYLITPWLAKGMIHMVHGGAGSGKSYFLGHQLYAASQGISAGPFSVEKPVRILYIDAEMGRVSVDKRLRSFVKSYGDRYPENFWYIAPSCMDIRKPEEKTDLILNILSPSQQMQIEAAAHKLGAQVVVIDNVRTATPGMEENDAQAWAPINDWLRRLRNGGLTVVWVHHDNKSVEGRSYAGSTAAAAATEIVLHVQPWSDDDVNKAAEAAAFWQSPEDEGKGPHYTVTHGITVSYTKNRELDRSLHKKEKLIYVQRLENSAVKLKSWHPEPDTGEYNPAFEQLSPSEKAYFLHKLRQISQAETARILGCSRQNVSARVKGINPDNPDTARRLAAAHHEFFSF